MDLGLRGRGYIVTGGTRGLGRATAEHLLTDGAGVLVVGRDPERAGLAAEELNAQGADQQGRGTAHGLGADLTDPDSATRIIAAATEHLTSLDGAVLSVGGPPPGRFRDTTEEDWRRGFEQVHLGPLRLARGILDQATAPIAITFVLSSSVRTPLAGLAVSNGLRPGLAMAAKTMADEYGPDGHRINSVLPGRIDTDRVRELDDASGDPAAMRAQYAERVPLGRYGRPEEFGAVAAFVTSPMASYLSGSLVTVDGGLTRAH